MKIDMTRITYEEFHNLKPGDIVFVKCGGRAYKSKVLGKPFYNADADDPDWEVETNNGFCDVYSLYI